MALVFAKILGSSSSELPGASSSMATRIVIAKRMKTKAIITGALLSSVYAVPEKSPCLKRSYFFKSVSRR